MRDDRKSKKQLIDELTDLRKRAVKLERLEPENQTELRKNGHKRVEEEIKTLAHAMRSIGESVCVTIWITT